MMTPREIILANIEHIGASRPGLNFEWGRINDMLFASPGAPAGYEQKRWTEGEYEYYDDIWGNIWWRLAERSAKGEIFKPALKDWDALETLEVPDYEDPQCYAGMREIFSQPTDLFRIAHIGGWVFDDARYLRKLEVYLMDMGMYPDELMDLNARVAGVYEAKVRGAAECGADGIMIGEDLGTQNGLLFSPEMWRFYFKDIYTRLWGLAHEHGMKVFMHSCGYNWELLDDLIEAGVDCFQFDQPAVYDMPALAEKLRMAKVALWSPIDIQKVLPTGDRAFIEEETEKMIEIFNGGLILKNYPDLHGIGVEPEWDQWAYEKILELACPP